MLRVVPSAAAATSSWSNRAAWTLWVIALLFIGVLILGGNRRSVTPAYQDAAQHWLNSVPLYDDSGRGFIYLPTAAVAYIPFAILPHAAGEFAWRVLTIGCYAWALWRACRLLKPNEGRELFLLAT